MDAITRIISTQPRVVDFLRRLANAPPQVLILEGGLADERVALALYWAARLNCSADSPPCLRCSSCTRIIHPEHPHRDLFFLDGREGSIKIETIRDEIRPILAQPPREGAQRVVILAEAQALSDEAANALLKSLEEPRPWTRFLLLAPQRERLLPTLVSRGWALTLAWPHDSTQRDPDQDEALRSWRETLIGFLKTGRGWMERTSRKGELSANIARLFVLGCQRDLAAVLSGRPGSELAEFWTRCFDVPRLRQVDVALDEAQAALDSKGTPALVLDCLALRLFGWMPRA